MNIKEWFEKGTNLKIKELRYLKMPQLPYNIFVDDKRYCGADENNNIVEHSIVIEHYSECEEKSNEKIIENFLNKEKKHYEKSKEWLQDENIFVTIYELDTFLEKERKNEKYV